MAVDKVKAQVDDRLVTLGLAITDALEGRSQRWLADEVGVDASAITRIIKGQMKDLTLERVREIEAALELPAGALLRAAGYVEETLRPEDALRQDLSLPRLVRESMARTVEGMRRPGHQRDGVK